MIHVSIPHSAEDVAFVRGLIGLPHRIGAQGPEAYDCFNLFAALQKRLCGRDVPWSDSFLPGDAGPRDVLEAFRWSEVQRQWPEVERPRHGDAVLMARSAGARHIGFWLDFGPEFRGCLHATSGQGVVLETLGQLRVNHPRIRFARCADRTLGALAGADRTFLPHCVSDPVAVHVADILNPLAGAELRTLAPGDPVWRALDGHPDPDSRWIVLNDTPLLRRHPETGVCEFERRVRPGDVVWVLPPLPLDDDRGSQVLASVLAILVAVAAPVAAGFLAPGLATNSLGFKLLTAGVAIAGQGLISALVPAPPGPPELADPNPTYSFGRFGNRMRPGARIPRPFGTMHREPDLLAPAYAEYVNNEQYVNILLCLGLGRHELREFGIGDSPVWTAEGGYTGAIGEIEHEILYPGDVPTLFPSQIEVSPEVDALEMPEPDQATGPVVIGPFAAVASGKTADVLMLDFAVPRGLFDPDKGNTSGNFALYDGVVTPSQAAGLSPELELDAGASTGSGGFGIGVAFRVSAQLIDDFGQAVGFAQVLATKTVVGDTTTPQRFTLRFPVERGRYMAWVERVTGSTATGSGAQDLLAWTGLKAQRSEEVGLPAVTALALRVRAGATAQTGLSNWYTITTAVLPHVDVATGEIVTGPTEQIDAAVLHIARSDDENGLALSDARIDLDQLRALAAVWAARGDVCCTVIEDDMEAWDALTLVLGAGRTRASFVGDTLTFVRDGPRIAPTKVITRADMVRGSLSVRRQHFIDTSAVGVTMIYRDRRGRMRSMKIPADAPEGRTAQVRSLVHVDPEHVWRDGNFKVAETLHRRRFVSWVGLAAAGALLPGELVEIAHPRPSFGAGGRVVARDGLMLEMAFDHGLAPGEQGWLTLKQPDGGWWGEVRCHAADTRRVAVDAGDFDALLKQGSNGAYSADFRDWLSTEADGGVEGAGTVTLGGRQAGPTHAAVGRATARPLWALIVDVIPTEAGRVEVLAVEYAAQVHEADTAPMPQQTDIAPALTNDLRPAWTDVVITGTLMGTTPETADVTVAGAPVPGAVRYLAARSITDSPTAWTQTTEAAVPNFTALGMLDGHYLRVAAAGPVLAGPWRVYLLDFSTAQNGVVTAIFQYQED